MTTSLDSWQTNRCEWS